MKLFDLLRDSDEVQFVLLRIVLILFLTWLAAKLIARVTRKHGPAKLHYRFIHNIVTLITYAVGIVTAMDQIPNFDSAFETFLAGSGIMALALSLAAQESLGNFINGLVISASKPFEVGDRIRLVNGNITGYIEDITMRHTVVRTFMNSRVIIPNSVINKDMIENSNFLEERASGFLDTVITHDSDIERAIEIMSEVVGEHPDFVDTRTPDQAHLPKAIVYVRSLSVYGVELRTSVTTASINNNFSTCSDVRLRLKLAYDAAGITFATAPIAAPPPGN